MKTVHMIGNAHIDPVWLWQWTEGYQEIKATFQSALDRLNETEDFVFTSACAEYYRWVEHNAPDMFEQIRRRVAEGRWCLAGGMWIQPDCNLPSGESFARHLLYSQRYFYEKFGIIARTGYNVDSFGHSGMLPQLLSKAGIHRYVFMRPDKRENPAVPGSLFEWYSPDGSHVTTFRIPDGYGSAFGDCAQKIDFALSEADRCGYPMMCFYGVGNHGGGPTIQNIQSVLRYQSGQPRGDEVVFSSPDRYFDQLSGLNLKLPEWRGELQHHASGCYSACSLIKQLNRATEGALLRAEQLGALSAQLTGHRPDAEGLHQAWRNLMFNQFHDIMGGCSIREAYQDAQLMLHEAQSIAAREQNAALQKISWQVDTIEGLSGRKRSKESSFSLWELAGQGTPVVVFNPHSFECTGDVVVHHVLERVTDASGQAVASQIVRSPRTNGRDKWSTLFRAQVPALGYRLYWVYIKDEQREVATPQASGLKVTPSSLENGHLSARFDPLTGALISLVSKRTGREALSGPARPQLIDIEHCDTWAHGIFRFDRPAGTFSDAQVEVLEEGPVRAALRITTRFGASRLEQTYLLYADADQLEVSSKLLLQEKHRLLKLCFPLAVQSPVARAEISYGFIERQPNGEEETGHRWMQLGDENGGLCVLNDGKYSFSAQDNELRFTVANSSIYADHYGQQTRDGQCEHMDMSEMRFRYALLPHEGDWRQAGFTQRGALLNMPMPHVVETYHEGPLPAVSQGMSISADNVVLGALKRTEQDDGYVLRLHECCGRPVTARVELPLWGRSFEAAFGPSEIKSFVLNDDPAQPVRECWLTELDTDAQ